MSEEQSITVATIKMTLARRHLAAASGTVQGVRRVLEQLGESPNVKMAAERLYQAEVNMDQAVDWLIAAMNPELGVPPFEEPVPVKAAEQKTKKGGKKDGLQPPELQSEL